MRRPDAPTLLAISDLRMFRGSSGIRRWALSLPADAAIQLREKDLGPAARIELGRTLRRTFPGLLIINGDPEVALSCGADGVHLPADQPWAELAPAIRGRGLILGVSTHQREEVEAAMAVGADYALFGPVFDSPEKRRFGPAQGLERLRRAVEVGLPILAVGGVDPKNAPALAVAGAHGVAAIRAFVDARTGADLAAAWSRATGTIPTP